MFAIYFATMLLSNLVANNAVAALMFPVAMNVARRNFYISTLCCSDVLFRRERHLSKPYGCVADAGSILCLHVSLWISDQPNGVRFGRIHNHRFRQVWSSNADLADGHYAYRSLLGRPLAACMDRLVPCSRSGDFVEEDQRVMLHVKGKDGVAEHLIERAVNDAAHGHTHRRRSRHTEWNQWNTPRVASNEWAPSCCYLLLR